MGEHGGAPAPNELRFTRVFDAPRELVFRCMVDPDHLTHAGIPPLAAVQTEGDVAERLDDDGEEHDGEVWAQRAKHVVGVEAQRERPDDRPGDGHQVI